MAWGRTVAQNAQCGSLFMGLCDSVSSRLGAYTVTPEGPCCQFFGFLCVHVYVVVCGMNSKESLRNDPIPLV